MTIEYIKDADVPVKVQQEAGVKLLVFYADWCPHCHHMLPRLQEVEKEYGDKIQIFIVNVSDAPKACAKYEVRAIPVICFIKNTKEADRITGEESLEILKKKIKDLL